MAKKASPSAIYFRLTCASIVKGWWRERGSRRFSPYGATHSRTEFVHYVGI